MKGNVFVSFSSALIVPATHSSIHDELTKINCMYIFY